jgi:hypothetical protein
MSVYMFLITHLCNENAKASHQHFQAIKFLAKLLSLYSEGASFHPRQETSYLE